MAVCIDRCACMYVHVFTCDQVEAAQDANAPVVRRPNYLWWSASYHMQNPVENLEPGTRLVFTVKDQSTEVVPNGQRAVAGGGDVQELGWGMIHVNRSTMNSQVGWLVSGCLIFLYGCSCGTCSSVCMYFIYMM